MASQRDKAKRVIEEYGRTFADELGVRVEQNTPSPLFRLFCFALLASARISHDIAMRAAKALAEQGWTTAAKLQDTTWAQRTKVLNRSGYARYDESTSRMFGDSADLLMEEYSGDLRKLRSAADGDLDDMRRRLKAFKGIGDSGADLFLREVQLAWDEVYPFVDARGAKLAKQFGFPDDARALARLVDGRKACVRLIDGLVRIGYEKERPPFLG
jgi:hypothetical protein